jgi:hypothetical protein
MSEERIVKAVADRAEMGTETAAAAEAGGERGFSNDGITTPSTGAGRAMDLGAGVHASGVFAAGGVGGLADGAAEAGYLGQAANEFYGTDTLSIGVVPSGKKGGAIRPEQAQRFIDYVWDGTVLAKDGRRVSMRANTMELEKVNVGERVIRAANQADDTYVNAGARFSKVDLTTTKIRLDWEVSTEALEDNLEGAALEDHIVRLMTAAFANDLEDLAINGTGAWANGNFLGIMEGFVHKVQVANPDNIGGKPADASVAVNGFDNWTPEAMQAIILAMPRKYRAIMSGLKFYAGSTTFADIVAQNGTLPGHISTDAYRNTYLGGAAQEIGGPRTTSVLGVNVLEVPYYPDNYVDLTFPANRVWGIQRNITVNREYVAKKDTIEWTVYVRFGLAWEELGAIAFAKRTPTP